MTRMYSFRLDPGLIDRVDAAKGDASRTTFLVRALEAMLEGVALDARRVATEARIDRAVAADEPSGLPLWVCSKCGWSKAALTPRSCPEHGIAPVEKQL